MDLIITLRKEVTDEATAQILLDIVADRLSDQPDVTVTGHVTSNLDLTPQGP